MTATAAVPKIIAKVYAAASTLCKTGVALPAAYTIGAGGGGVGWPRRANVPASAAVLRVAAEVLAYARAIEPGCSANALDTFTEGVGRADVPACPAVIVVVAEIDALAAAIGAGAAGLRRADVPAGAAVGGIAGCVYAFVPA